MTDQPQAPAAAVGPAPQGPAPIDRAYRASARSNQRPSPKTPIDASRANIKPPLDFQPGAVRGEGPAAMRARAVLEILHQTWTEVGEAAGKMNVDLPELARVAQGAVERALRGADKARESIAREVELASRAVDAKIAPAVPDVVQSEIRSHWAQRVGGQRAGASRKEAFGELLEAVRGDSRTSSAILSGPAYLSGLDAERFDTVRASAVEAHAKEEAARLQEARQAGELVARASKRLLDELGWRIGRWTSTNPLARLEVVGRE